MKQNGKEANVNVLVISSSLRNGSNSELLANEFAAGAAAAGNEVEEISLKGKRIGFCTGCLSCQRTGECCIADDSANIIRKMHDADVIAFASPVYYYGISGQLKTLLDRANPLYDSDYRFKDIYLILTAAENEADTADRAISCLTGWVDCFERSRIAKVIFAGGVNGRDEANGHPSMKDAYETGNQIGK